MNKQARLLQQAKRFNDNPAVRALLQSIEETTLSAEQALQGVDAAANVLRMGLRREDGFYVPLDNSNIVVSASKAAAALSTQAACFTNLACVLQALGEDIDY